MIHSSRQSSAECTGTRRPDSPTPRIAPDGGRASAAQVVSLTAARAARVEATVNVQRGGGDIIDGLRDEWQAMCGEDAFHRPEWTRAFVRAFASDQILVVVSARIGGRLCAVLPLIEATERVLGVSTTVLRSASNVHSCRYDLLRAPGEDGDAAARALWEHLMRDTSWSRIELCDVPREGELASLATSRAEHGLLAIEESIASPYFALPDAGADWEEWLGGCVGGDFRRELRRRSRRLAGQGEVDLLRVDCADPVALHDFYRLESSGWKGQTGTAIDRDRATRAFYDDVASAAAAGGYLALYFLRLNGQAIAAHFGFSHAGRYLLLKAAYDESYARFAPGQQLVQAVARDCHTRGMKEFDFLGSAMDWKLQWTVATRPLKTLHLYRRNTAGRLMYLLRFGWKATLKRVAARVGLGRWRWGDGERLRSKAADGLASGKYFATALPLLLPGMLRPRRRPLQAVFPFAGADTRYFYQGRNAIFALAESWQLAGQEVLFPAYFHGVELEALLAAGVRPSFYPVHKRMRVDADEVVSHITSKTRAVYLIHYFGMPGPVREIAAACRQHGIPLIEDCALALLSKLGDRPLGTFGDAAIFSLHKSLPVPNGGALVLANAADHHIRTDRAPLRAAISALADAVMAHYERRGSAAGQWIVSRAASAGKRAAVSIDMPRVEVGSQNFDRDHARLGMNGLVHCILANQRFAEMVVARRRNFAQLAERLRPLGASVFDHLQPGVCPLFFPIVVRQKAALLEALDTRGIQAINFWSLNAPSVPVGAFPEVDEMRRTVVELPCHQDLTPQHMDRIANAVLELGGLVR